MSNGEVESLPEEFDELARSVLLLLERYDELGVRAAEAEARVEELESAMRDLSSGTLDPVAMSARLDELETENQDLRRRMDEARERVRKVMARFDFIREGR